MHLHYGMPHCLIIDLGKVVETEDVYRLRREFQTYLRRGVKHVVLCMEDLRVVDQEFFPAVNDLHKGVKEWGGCMIAAGATPEIRNVMQVHDRELLHFDRVDKEVFFFYAH